MNSENKSRVPKGLSEIPVLVAMGSAPQVFGMSRSYIYELAAQRKISLKKNGPLHHGRNRKHAGLHQCLAEHDTCNSQKETVSLRTD